MMKYYGITPPPLMCKWKREEKQNNEMSCLKSLTKLHCCFKRKTNNHSNRFVIIRTCAINGKLLVIRMPGIGHDEVLAIRTHHHPVWCEYPILCETYLKCYFAMPIERVPNYAAIISLYQARTTDMVWKWTNACGFYTPSSRMLAMV